MAISLRGSRGLSLTELLVALVISSILTAAVYRTFIRQQKTYMVQEQVVDMQQNVRVAISGMMREIRMAGFGGDMTAFLIGGKPFGAKTLSNVITAGNPTAGLTVITVGGSTTLAEDPTALNQIKVTSLTDSQGNTLFDTGVRKYISVNGLELRVITAVNTDTKTLTVDQDLSQNPKRDAPVFALRAVSYQLSSATLTRDENLGGGAQPLADNMNGLQFQYLDENGNTIADPVANAAKIRVVSVSVTARTSTSDPDYKGGDGYRTRTITSNIRIRNMGLGS